MSSSALTAGLAGCLSNPGSTSEESSKPAVSFSAEVRNSFTPDQPGRIRLRFENETDSKLLFLTQESPGQRGMFIPVKGVHRSSSAELLLLQPGAIACQTEMGTPPAIPATPTDMSNGDGCWRPPCEELILSSFEPTWEELDPDAPWEAGYLLLDGFNDTCLPVGDYDFTATGRVVEGHLTEDGQVRFDAENYHIERRLTVTIDDNQEVRATADAAVSEVDSSG